MTTKQKHGKGRKRTFDLDAALATGQRLFHDQGYAAVGVAALTEAIGIKPPSFYAAFGNKAAFFQRVAERYANATLRADEILTPGRPPVEALEDLMRQAALQYASEPCGAGCLVLENARSSDDGGLIAGALMERRRQEVREFVEATHPQRADAVADYVVAVMSGLSASARRGLDRQRLLAIADNGSNGLGPLLASERRGSDEDDSTADDGEVGR